MLSSPKSSRVVTIFPKRAYSARVVQNLYAKPFAGLIQPVDVPLAGLDELQRELLLVAPMRDMPNVARHKIAIGSWHGIPLQNDNDLYLSYGPIFAPKNRPISLFLGLKLTLFVLISNH
jgi:hypothetical protein